VRGVNKIILMGRISEPEIQEVGKNNTKLARFGIVTEYQAPPAFSGPNKGKKKPVVTSWHNVTAWQRNAELVEQYLSKGDVVYIEGRVEYNEVEDGPKYTNITVEKIEFVANTVDRDDEDEDDEAPPPRKKKAAKKRRPEPEEDEDEDEEEEPAPRKKASKPKQSSVFDPDDDDLPF